MGEWFSMLRYGKAKHRTLLLLGLVAVAVLIAAGCTQSGGVPPPSGPIGGGCG